MPTKDDFRGLIRTIVNRGTVADATIDAATMQAVSFIENNWNLRYMYFKERYTVSLSFFLLTQTYKRLDVLRVPDLNNGGTIDLGPWINLRQVDEDELASIAETVVPTAFYTYSYPDVTGAKQAIQLNVIDGFATFDLDLFGYRKTVWANVAPPSTHWLLENAIDWLIAKTMTIMAGYIRQPEILAYWQGQEQVALPALLNADNEYKQGSRDERMSYTGEVVP